MGTIGHSDITQRINKNGAAVITVIDGEVQYAYTIGLTEKGLSEVIVLGDPDSEKDQWKDLGWLAGH